MLKLKDSNDKVIAILDDEDEEPQFITQQEILQEEDVKKNNKKNLSKYSGQPNNAGKAATSNVNTVSKGRRRGNGTGGTY